MTDGINNESAEQVQASVENTKTISIDEYNQFMQYKQQLEELNKQKVESVQIREDGAAQIDKETEKEIFEAKNKEEFNKMVIEKSREINQISELSSKVLSKHYHTDVLIAKGYKVDDILLAQKRELVRKFVSPSNIWSISQVKDISSLKDGVLLGQLVNLARDNIKDMSRKQIETKKMLSQEPLLANETMACSDPNFHANSFSELREGVWAEYRRQIDNKYYSRSLSMA